MLDPRKVDEYKRFFAEFTLITKGDLDKEYTRVKELIAEWDKRNNLEEENRKLKQREEDLQLAEAKFEKQSTKYTADMKTWHAALTQKETSLNKREQDTAQKEYALSDAQAKHEANVRAVATSNDAKAKELAKKAQDLDSLQADLHKREKDLSAKHARVDAVMASMATMR